MQSQPIIKIYSPSRIDCQSQFANQFRTVIEKQKHKQAVQTMIRDFSFMLFFFMILCLIICLPALV